MSSYYERNREKILAKRRAQKDVLKERRRKHYEKNKEEIKKRNKEYSKENRDSVLENSRRYYNDNKEVISKKRAANYIRNKDKIIEQQKEYTSKSEIKEMINSRRSWRYSNDSEYKILMLLRGRVSAVLKGKRKLDKTVKLLGCSVNEFKQHLQETAIANGYINFNIEDYSGREFHIDHIIPCNSFNLNIVEEQYKCFHYSNMQILTSQENLSKGDKIL